MNYKKKPTVLLLSGQAESGKDFCANIFKEQLEVLGKRVLITHFADLLKFICKSFFDWNGEKDEKGRTLLQYVGTDVVRKLDPDYWVAFLVDIIDKFEDKWDYVIIPDTRFPNEVDYFYEYSEFKTYSIRVIRPGHKSKLSEEQRNHISETSIDNVDCDICIINTTKENTEYEISKIINRIDKNINPKKKNAFIDLDGVVLNTVKCINDLYNEDYCYFEKYKEIPWQDIKTWNFTELSAAKPEYIDMYFNQKRFFDKIEMFSYAEDMIEELNKNYNIIFVSHGFSPNLKLKEQWIEKNFPYAQFIGVNLKEHKDKSCVDMSGEGNIFIDDKASNLESSNAEIKICFGKEYEWNKDWIPNDKNKYRLKNWWHIQYIPVIDL